MKIATWNVNSIRVRLPHVLAWLEKEVPDVLCLQELKCESAVFPRDDFRELGYQVQVAGQKTYNGVALVSRCDAEDVVVGMPLFDDVQQRVLAATFQGVRVISVYCPNGESLTSDKYTYKLRWFDALHDYLKSALSEYPRLVVAGDYNIAPEDRDVHDPVEWAGEVLCSLPERDRFKALLNLGLVDGFRQFPQEERAYSWWHYRVNAFKRNLGLRIDHVLASTALTLDLRQCTIDRAPRGWERPSDHAPVVAEFL
ncbi:MAG: exodeoxyribonuclease III [Ferrovum sp.]|nr:exodeoxyribonuclease III [Ferrovum sp.]NDU87407.1 exodeoxyribonuclease III [Ferrovum sp.]